MKGRHGGLKKTGKPRELNWRRETEAAAKQNIKNATHDDDEDDNDDDDDDDDVVEGGRAGALLTESVDPGFAKNTIPTSGQLGSSAREWRLVQRNAEMHKIIVLCNFCANFQGKSV